MCSSDFHSIEGNCPKVNPSRVDAASPCIMVIFGASGDLARRKLMPALYSLDYDQLLDENFTIVGFARSEKQQEQFKSEMREAIRKSSRKDSFSQKVWQRFSSRLHYFIGKYDDPESHTKFGKFLSQLESLCGAERYLYYLALPPTVTEAVLGGLAGGGPPLKASA